MSEDRESIHLVITSTGVLALVFPTALQVVWLIAVAVAAVFAARAAGRGRTDP